MRHLVLVLPPSGKGKSKVKQGSFQKNEILPLFVDGLAVSNNLANCLLQNTFSGIAS